jgi:putative FmdB family regulatory protein
MPIYEFQCSDCGKPFEKLVRSSSAVAEIECPTCGSHTVQKKMSSFAIKGGSSGFSLAGGSSSGDGCSTGGT